MARKYRTRFPENGLPDSLLSSYFRISLVFFIYLFYVSTRNTEATDGTRRTSSARRSLPARRHLIVRVPVCNRPTRRHRRNACGSPCPDDADGSYAVSRSSSRAAVVRDVPVYARTPDYAGRQVQFGDDTAIILGGANRQPTIADVRENETKRGLPPTTRPL